MAPSQSGSSGGSDADLASRIIEETLTWGKQQRKLKEKDKKAQRQHLSDIRNQQGRIRATLAIRSGFERRCQADAIERLAEQEWKEASNGIQN